MPKVDKAGRMKMSDKDLTFHRVDSRTVYVNNKGNETVAVVTKDTIDADADVVTQLEQMKAADKNVKDFCIRRADKGK